MRTLLYSVGITCLALIGFGFFFGGQTTAEFSPRAEEEKSSDWLGAAEMYDALRANVETGEVNPEDAIKMRNAVAKYTKATATQKDSEPIPWVEMGPDNVGGRTRGIAIITESHIMAGGVSGGLWQTFNGGNDWSQITSFPNCNVGSIVQAGNGDIYVGTGSMFDSSGGTGGSGFIGQGVYRSTDLGETWTIIEDTDPGLLGLGDWTAVDALERDPNNDSRVWVGSNAGFGYIDGDQVFMGADGLPGQSCQDIHIAHDGSYMLVAMGSGRVYRSTNSDFSAFDQEFGSGDGNLPQSGIGRARVYVVPGHPEQAYVLFATQGGGFGGVYSSQDNGQTWGSIWPSGNPEITPLPRNQGIYDLCIGASPNDPTIAYVGGIEFWRCGPNYQPELAALPFDSPGLDIDMHVDMHEIIYSPEGVMWVGCDGGIYRSNDAGETYIETNRGFNTTQYYGIAFSPNNGVGGGTQDNGTHFIPNDGTFISNQSAFDVSGGDGFDTAIPQVTDIDQSVIFTTSQNGVLGRYTEGGAGGGFYDDEIIDLLDDDGEIGSFYTNIQLYEDTEDEDSQHTIILINPYTETVTDSTFVVQTNNMDIDFEYTLGEGEELRFWEELIRPELSLDAPLEEDPNYFWLDPQELTETIIDCDTMMIEDGEEIVIDEIIPIDSCFYFQPLDSVICINLGFDTTYTTQPTFDIQITCDTTYFYAADTLQNVREHLLIQDPYSSMLTIGFIGQQGVWMTRDALNFNTQPNWWRLGTAPGGGGTKEMEFVVGDHPEAGDVMYLTGWNGQVWRISGLKNLWSDEDYVDILNNDTGELTAINDDGEYIGDGYLDVLDWELIFSSGGTPVTGMGVDPNDPAHVVITIGGYGGSQKVRETFNALDDQVLSSDWDNIWITSSDLDGMPCYDAVIDVTDPSGQTIIVGTEFGAFRTQDGGDTWVASNEGMQTASDVFACPIFDIRQQWIESRRWTYPTNYGYIYAGTHGRGIFSADMGVVSVDESDDMIETAANQLLVYPNPVTQGVAQMQLDLAYRTDVEVTVFSSTGKLVQQIPYRNLAEGQHNLTLDVSELSNGNYIVAVQTGDDIQTAHFVVMK